MRRYSLLAILLVMLMAVPAFAGVENVQLTGFVNSTWVVRDQFDLGGASNDYYQNLFITQTGIQIDADLTENVGVTIRLLNERAWGEENEALSSDEDGDTDVDLNLAFVDLKDILNSPVSARVGRQQYRQLNGFNVDFEGTNNVASSETSIRRAASDLTLRTAYDGIRLTADLNPVTLNLFAMKGDTNTITGPRGDDDDVDLYGANANYQFGDERGTEATAYFWAKIDHSTEEGAGEAKARTIYMPGVHIASNPFDGLHLEAEGAWQLGNHVISGDENIKRHADAYQFIANYQVPVAEEYNPVAQYVYTYVSGDSDPGCTDSECKYYNAWDPFLETQGGGTIYNTLFDLTNAHIHEVSISGSPMEDLSATFKWSGIWLDKEATDSGTTTFSLRQPDATSETVTVTSDEKVGDEFGAEFVYDYTEDVQLGFLMSWFFPGNFFHDDNDAVAKQFLTSVDVAF